MVGYSERIYIVGLLQKVQGNLLLVQVDLINTWPPWHWSTLIIVLTETEKKEIGVTTVLKDVPGILLDNSDKNLKESGR